MNRDHKPPDHPVTLLFPGGASWESWRVNRRGEAIRAAELSLTELERFVPEGTVLVALPVQSSYALPIRAFGKDAAEFHNTAGLELEKQGLVAEERTGDYGVEILEREGDQAVLRIDALGSFDTPLPEEVLICATFAVASRLLPIAPDRGYLWKELGRVVGAVGRRGGVLYSSVLNGTELGEAEVEEVIRWCRRFHLRGLADLPKEIVVWGNETIPGLPAQVAMIPVRQASFPPPEVRGIPGGQIVPARVVELRTRRLRRRRTRGWVAAAGGALTLLAGVMLALVHREQKAVAELHDRVKELSAQVSLVREAQGRWAEVRAAVDPDLAPLEVIKRINDLASSRNVQVSVFESGHESLAIHGSASSLATALAFLSDLSNHPDFPDFEWSYPQPEVTPDGKGLFHIDGKTRDTPSAEDGEL